MIKQDKDDNVDDNIDNGLTLRMVPKKSSTNFWTVPFVDSKRVRKISGMDLQQGVNQKLSK